MFILPIAHEESTVRRWPVVTIGILIVNIAMLVFTMFRVPGDIARLETRLEAASHYARDRPWVRGVATPGCLTLGDAEVYTRERTLERPPEPGSVEETEARAQMKVLCGAVDKARAESFLYRFGFVPDSFTPYSLVTHQFLHGGILHLVFNLWFLWLSGCNLEDRWGRGLFLLFYVGGGIGAAFVHKLFASDTGVPLIGASGSIAAAMGAFLAVLGATRIRFFYLYAIGFRFRTGTFEASAYWMLPLWLVTEVVEAFVLKKDGVAHFAHVGGFVLGLLVGLAMRFSGADAKLNEKQDEALTVLREDPAMARAAELVDRGQFGEAIEKLKGLAAQRPDDVDVQVELLRAATLARDLPLRQRTYARLLVLYLNQDFADAATEIYREVQQNRMEDAIPRATAFVIAQGFARHKRLDFARLAYAQARRDGLVDELAVRAGVAEATALRALHRRADARALLDECKASPFSTVELDAQIEAQLAQLGPMSIDA
ncbi:MAG: rhomboid family intramembrane serine protease [Polyangiaceae bacterium]